MKSSLSRETDSIIVSLLCTLLTTVSHSEPFMYATTEVHLQIINEQVKGY